MYGEIDLDDLILDVVESCPELKRLKLIGMMNFKSVQMLPLTSISRLEHTIGLAYLAQLLASGNPHLQDWKNDLLVAALYHDVNCGSFGHSVEWAIDRFSPYNHEEKVSWVEETQTLAGLRDKPIFLEQDGLHRHRHADKYSINFSRVNGLVNGTASYVLNNSGIDLDNIDNVLRMAHSLGKLPKTDMGVELVRRLRVVPGESNFVIDSEGLGLVQEWRRQRSDVYECFIYTHEYMAFEYLVFELIQEHAKLVETEGLANLFHYTDERLLWWFYDNADPNTKLRDIAKRLLLHELPHCHGILRSSCFKLKRDLEKEGVLSDLSAHINAEINKRRGSFSSNGKLVSLHLTTDDRKTSRCIPILVEEAGRVHEELLGEDERYILLAVLSDRHDSSNRHDAYAIQATARVLKDFGLSDIEPIKKINGDSRAPQYALL